MVAAPHNYLRQAARLRWCLYQNLEDGRHAREGERFVYIMDANVVRFFINPKRDRNLVNAFSRALAGDAEAGTALVTAEYLFSRKLPGQNDTPAFIAPSHGDDLQSIIMAIGDEPTEIEDSAHQELAQEALQKLVDDIDSQKRDTVGWMSKLREVAPNLTDSLLDSPFLEASQLLRLYDQDLLRPLWLHRAATKEVMDRDTEATRQYLWWKSRLRDEHHLYDRSPGEDNLSRDTEVVLQVQRLDQAAQAQGVRCRYVLITADRVLFDAYARWYWLLPQEERDRTRFVLRSLMQYVPLLNVQDMPNGIGDSDVIARARDALDALLFATPEYAVEYPQKLAFHRLPPLPAPKTAGDASPRTESEPAPGPSSNEMHKISSIWNASFRNSVLLNTELLHRRLHTEFESLAKLFRKKQDLLVALHEEQRRIIKDVFAAHASIATTIDLKHLTLPVDVLPVECRTRLVLQTRFRTILRDESLEVVLDHLVRGDEETGKAIAQRLAGAERTEAILFAACLAHRCQRWSAARLYTSWLLDNIAAADSILRGDLIYLRSSVARHEFLTSGSVIETYLQLCELQHAADIAADAFSSARALCERTSLVLSTLFRDRFLPTPEIKNIVAACSDVNVLEAALRSAASVGALPSDDNDLQFQSDSNVLRAWVYARFISAEDKSLRAATVAPPVLESLRSVSLRLDQLVMRPVQKQEMRLALEFLGEKEHLAADILTHQLAAALQFESTLDAMEFEVLASAHGTPRNTGN